MKVIVLKKKSAVVLALFLAICSILMLCNQKSRAYNVFYNQTVRQLPIYCVQTEKMQLAISFDCAWGVERTDKILQILEQNNILATFFTVEFWTQKHPDYIKKISDLGHEIGTHSATHSHMSRQSQNVILQELNSSSKAISDITNKKVDLFRAPFGDYNDRLITTAKNAGFFTIQWDVDSLDWKDLSGQQIAMRVLNKAKQGSIVLFHNNATHILDALPIIIATLKNKGFEFVPIGDLIYKENYYIDSQGKQIKNA